MSENATHQLDEKEMALLADIERDLLNLQQQRIGAVRLMLKTRGLEGNWTLNGDTLQEAK